VKDGEFQKYLQDNGVKSRKLWVTLIGIALISSLGVAWAIYSWQESLFNTITSGLVTLIIAFLGINAGRAALPATAAYLNKTKSEETENDQ
jgi:hypothetical protein